MASTQNPPLTAAIRRSERRIAFALIGALLLSVGLISLFSTLSARDLARQTLTRNAESAVSAVISEVLEFEATPPQAIHAVFVGRSKAESDLFGLYIVTPTGRIIDYRQAKPFRTDADVALTPSRIADKVGPGQSIIATSEGDIPVWMASHDLPGTENPPLKIVAAYDMRPMRQTIWWTSLQSALLALLASTALAALLIGLLHIYLWRPMISFTRSVARATGSGHWTRDLEAERAPPTLRLLHESIAHLIDGVSSHRVKSDTLSRVARQAPIIGVITEASGRVQWVNDSFIDFAGMPADEAVGQRWPDLLIRMGIDPSVAERVDRSIRKAHPFRLDKREMPAPHGAIPSSLTGVPVFDDTGSATNFLILENLSAASLNQSRLAHTQQLNAGADPALLFDQQHSKLQTKAAELRSGLSLSGQPGGRPVNLQELSHELRTPMNGILGLTHLLLESDLKGQPREYVSMIHDASQTLAGILDQMTRAPGAAQSHTKVDIAGVLRSVIGTLNPLATQKGLDIELNETGLSDIRLISNESQIKQILFNLIGNAIKFTHVGRIGISAAIEPDTATLRIDITDTGIGIASQELASVFEPGVRLTAGTEREVPGNGLGLALSRKMATDLGGSLELASGKGQGTTAIFRLPLRAGRNSGAVRTPQETALPPRDAKSLSILLAEDHPINQRLMITILERFGHQVTLAENGAQALERLTAQPFDLVLMDIQMPEVDGLEATRRIRASDEAWRDIPIIAVTAHGGAEARHRYREAGINGYVPKPVNIDLLMTEITRTLSGQGSLKYSEVDDPADEDDLISDTVEPIETLLAEIDRR